MRHLVSKHLRGNLFFLAVSDYRGNLVVLYFSGSWSDRCMREVQHLREMTDASRVPGTP